MITQYEGKNVTGLSTNGVTWEALAHPDYFSCPILIIQDQLYGFDTLFLTASGSLSGIVGTWLYNEQYTKTWDDTTGYNEKYVKLEYTFAKDGTYTFKSYISTTGTYVDPTNVQNGTYTYSNGAGTITNSYNSSKITVYNNKYLVLGNENSASAYAFFKQ